MAMTMCSNTCRFTVKSSNTASMTRSASARSTALLLAEGVAERATDVDVVLVNGYGISRQKGGLVAWARERGGATLSGDLDELARCSGARFVRGDIDALMEGGDVRG
jgi:3-hydroxyacyl-CoA dehydrogenase